MKIIIAGAGDIGFHLAKSLSMQDHDITLIDTNQDILDNASQKLDVITILGDSSSVSILKESGIQYADIMLSMTTSEKNNIVTAILSKKLGCKRTIARVKNPEYLSLTQKKIFFKLGIDNVISPNRLAALEINRLLKRISLTDVFDFSDGNLQLLGVTIENNNKTIGKRVDEIAPKETSNNYRIIAVLRDEETIIPSSDFIIREDDHLFFTAKAVSVPTLLRSIKKHTKKVGRIMLIGNSELAYQTAAQLEQIYHVKMIIEDKNIAKDFAQKLPNTLIIHGDPGNLDLLEVEDISRMDAFIALTDINEVNILTSFLAREKGVQKTIARVDNIDYTHLSQSIGIDTLINPKIIAANNVYRFVRKSKIEAITSIHGVDAEIIEFIIKHESILTKKPIVDLPLPKGCVIGGVIRNTEEVYVPFGDFQMQVDDHVVIFAFPDAISSLEKLFNRYD